MSNDTDRLTIAEAATYADRPRETVSRWISSGLLPAERVGRRAYIQRADIDALIRPVCPRCRRTFEPDRPGSSIYCSATCQNAARGRRLYWRKDGAPLPRTSTAT